MKTTEKIKKLIKDWEGCRLTAYRCPAGELTIGHGHTGADVTPGMRITQEQADGLFEADMARFEEGLRRQMADDGVPQLTQGQYDALVSIAYNIGLDALRRSTLWRKLRADPADPSIPAEFRRWVHAKGRTLPGLVKRRNAEARIYSGGEYLPQ